MVFVGNKFNKVSSEYNLILSCNHKDKKIIMLQYFIIENLTTSLMNLS